MDIPIFVAITELVPWAMLAKGPPCIIAGLFSTLFSRLLGQTRGSLVAILGIAFYTFLVGADAAVVRAAIMGGLSLTVRQFGRRNDGLNALMLSAVIMSVFNPHIPWDVGFQLSFFATLGLILYAEPFQNWAVTLSPASRHRALPKK